MKLLQTLLALRAVGQDSFSNDLFARANTPTVIDPLSQEHREGLVAVVVTSFLSSITSAALLVFITYRFIFWRKYYRTRLVYNQYIVLIYNLLLADFQEALGFLLSIQWVATKRLDYNTASCFMQGWLLQVGDPTSGLWVLAIAVHTFATVLMGQKLSHRWFVVCVIGVWAFGILLALVPTVSHGRFTFMPTGAWVCDTLSFPPTRILGFIITNHKNPFFS